MAESVEECLAKMNRIADSMRNSTGEDSIVLEGESDAKAKQIARAKIARYYGMKAAAAVIVEKDLRDEEDKRLTVTQLNWEKILTAQGYEYPDLPDPLMLAVRKQEEGQQFVYDFIDEDTADDTTKAQIAERRKMLPPD